MEFNKYLHLEKYGNTAVEGINLGTVYVFPKLDGTNASVWSDEGKMCAGSRNRILSLENDNAGFLQWLKEETNDNISLSDFLYFHPHLRLFGEWLVPHTLKSYLDSAWRQFYVFDVYDHSKERYLSYEEYKPLLDEYGVNYIPCQKIIKNGEFKDFIHQATLSDYLLPVGTQGEGVVLKNYEFINKYGRYEAAKVVNTDFKASHRKEMGSPLQENKMTEDALSEFFTEEMARKVLAKIISEKGDWQSKYIVRLLETCYYDFFNEELWDAVKKTKAKSVDFSTLKHFIQNKTKGYLPEIF